MDNYNMIQLRKNKNFICSLPNRLNINMDKNKDKKEVLLSYLDNNKTKLIYYKINDENKLFLDKIINIFKERIKNNKLTIDKYIEIRNIITIINEEQIILYKDIIIDILNDECYEYLDIIKDIDKHYLSFVNRIAFKISSDIKDYDIVKELFNDGLKDMLNNLYEEVFASLKDNEITNKVFEINKNNLENLFLRLVFLDVRKYQIQKVSYDPHYRKK